MIAILLKSALVWLLFAVAEVMHGILRVRLLNRLFGDHRARQIGLFTGSGIILIIAWFSTPWLGATTSGQLFAVGLQWLALMLAFEIAFGRPLFRTSWERIAADFDFRKGALLSIRAGLRPTAGGQVARTDQIGRTSAMRRLQCYCTVVRRQF